MGLVEAVWFVLGVVYVSVPGRPALIGPVAVFWQGAGTAIGELPPYFMARAARLSGADPDGEDYEEFEEMLEQAENAQVRNVHFLSLSLSLSFFPSSLPPSHSTHVCVSISLPVPPSNLSTPLLQPCSVLCNPGVDACLSYPAAS